MPLPALHLRWVCMYVWLDSTPIKADLDLDMFTVLEMR